MLAVCNQEPARCEIIPDFAVEAHKNRMLQFNRNRSIDEWLTYSYIPVPDILSVFRKLQISQDPDRPVYKIRIGMTRDFMLECKVCENIERPAWSYVMSIAPWAGVFVLPMSPAGINKDRLVDEQTSVTGKIIHSKIKQLQRV